MDEAEQACCQALHRRPSCAKARFRRGQARLALGRPIEAAADFREVCVLEPNNAEAITMFRRAQEEGLNAPPPVVETCTPYDDNGKSETMSAVVALGTPSGSEAPLPPETTSTTGSGETVNGEPGKEGKSRGTKQNPVEAARVPSPLSVPSFMVPGWLTSAERQQGGHAHENDNRSTSTHHGHIYGFVSHGGSNTEKSGDAQDAVSVSRLVSQLSAAQNAGSKPGRASSPSTSGTIIAAAAQAEWSRMQLEEANKVQESLRRWSANTNSSGGQPAAEANTTTVPAVTKGKLDNKKRGDSRGKATKKSARTPTNTNETVSKASDWWTDLEEEESKVRAAFRSKLSIGEDPSTKNKKKKEREKDKAAKKKKAASRLRSDVPP